MSMRMNVKFETWEILTVFTIILTIASSLVWVSAFYPKNVENNFLWLERNKHKTYNIFLKIQKLSLKPLLNKDIKSDECYKQIIEINLETEDFQDKQNEIKNLQTEIAEIEKNKREQNLFGSFENNFNELLDNLDKYSEKTYKYQTETFNISQRLLTLKQSLSKVCSNFEENYPREKTVLQSLSQQILGNQNFQNNLNNLLNEFETNKYSQEEIVAKISQFMILQETSFLQFEKLKPDQDSFISKIETFETWQKNNMPNDTEKKIVFLLD
jgi:hypothetical protein